MSHERELSRRAKAFSEKQLVNFPFRQRRNYEQQQPKSSSNETRDAREKKASQRTRDEHDDCGKTPSTIARVPPARNSHKQNQRRNDRYE